MDLRILLERDNGEDDSRIYNYSFPNQKLDNTPEGRLIASIESTTEYKRLSDIRFLGALDYCLIEHPNGTQGNVRFTRGQHSTGVARLACSYLNLTEHNARERLICVAAAMLHDIGHPPFSHTLEPVFAAKFGIDHHSVSESIIYGRTPHSKEIYNILSSFGVDADEVVNVLNGDDKIFDYFFSGPINFDTIEGVLRSRNYIRMHSIAPTPLRVVEAATVRDSERARDIVDDFWKCKDDMYFLFIRSAVGVLFDKLFQAAAASIADQLSESDFYLTESQAFRKFPILRQATRKDDWGSLARSLLPQTIPYQIRRFFVDPQASFFDHDDAGRYLQTKTPGCLTLDAVLRPL